MYIVFKDGLNKIKFKSFSRFLSLREVGIDLSSIVSIESENSYNKIYTHYINTRTGEEKEFVGSTIKLSNLFQTLKISDEDSIKTYILIWFEEEPIMKLAEKWENVTVEILESPHHTSIGWKRQDNTKRVE